MNSRTSRNTFRIVAGAAAMTLAAASASAVPVNGLYIEDARCDPIATQSLPHELGNAAIFPINEGILVNVAQANNTVCVAQDSTTLNDWIVSIQNVSGQSWRNLFFCSNLGLTIGNADGVLMDVTNAPGVVTDAFRIDGTVTFVPNGNNNLLTESGAVDEIFSPGEVWRFNVSNFNNPNSTTFPGVFLNTPGIFGGSAPFNPALPDTASILATPVPEPSTIGAIALIGASVLIRRPSRKR
jgi:hypothetical protein